MNEAKTAAGRRKRWVPNLQAWSFVITIAWMAIANVWKPFGLFGFVCMFTPILIALSGRGKMHCARVCPRGSLIGRIGGAFCLGIEKPRFMASNGFKTAVWAVMMGSFIVMLILVVPKGVYAAGNAVLIFMEIATALAILSGILFSPRAWCTFCPMGTTTGRIRDLLNAAHERQET